MIHSVKELSVRNLSFAGVPAGGSPNPPSSEFGTIINQPRYMILGIERIIHEFEVP